MATEKQLQANSRNAQRSTGPRTLEGKSRSRWNALKTRLDAGGEILPNEDAQARCALDDSFRSAYRPASDAEHALVQTLAGAAWELRRLAQMEADFFRSNLGVAGAFLNDPRQFNRTITAQMRANRLYHRTLQD